MDFSHDFKRNYQLDDLSQQASGQQTQNFKQRNQQLSIRVSLNAVWKNNALVILMYVKRAVNSFLSMSSKQKFRLLQKQQLAIVNDFSSEYQYYKFNKLVNTKMNMVSSLFYMIEKQQNRFLKGFSLDALIVFPDSSVMLYLKSLLLTFYLILLTATPLKIAFYQEFQNQDIQRLELIYDNIVIILLACQLALGFFTAFYHKGELITKRKQIARSYIKGEFLFDSIIAACFVIAKFSDVKYFEIALLLKLFQTNDLVNGILQNFQFKQQIKATIDLVKLALTLLIIAHICGCIFYLITLVEQEGEGTWIIKQGLQNQPWLQQYVSSLYWAVVTMITLGYGDIVPISVIEKLFVTIMALVNCGVFGYSINNIGNIFNQLKQQETAKNKVISKITDHFGNRNIDHTLMMKSKRYLEYILEENENDRQSDVYFNKLSANLQREIKRDIYYKLIIKHQFFHLNFSQECLLELTEIVNEQKYGPDVPIIQEGEPNDKLFFLLSGNVELKTKVNTLQHLKPGDLFGKASFINEKIEKLTAESQNLVSIAYILQPDFIAALRQFPDDYEKYCAMRDNMTINLNSRGLDITCVSCQSYNHGFQQCHFIKYFPNRQKILYQTNKMKQEKRSFVQRRETRNCRPTVFVNYLHEAAIKIIIKFDLCQNKAELGKRVEAIRKSCSEGKEQFGTLDKIFEVESENILCDHDFSFSEIEIFSKIQHQNEEGKVQTMTQRKSKKSEISGSSDQFNFTITDAFDIDESPLPLIPEASGSNSSSQTSENYFSSQYAHLPQQVPKISPQSAALTNQQNPNLIHSPTQNTGQKPNLLTTEFLYPQKRRPTFLMQQNQSKEELSDNFLEKPLSTKDIIAQIKKQTSPKGQNASVSFDDNNVSEGSEFNEIKKKQKFKYFTLEIKDTFDCDKFCQWNSYMKYNNLSIVLSQNTKFNIKQSQINYNLNNNESYRGDKQKLLNKLILQQSFKDQILVDHVQT